MFINDVECTSRANAIDTVRMGKSELKIKLKRLATRYFFLLKIIYRILYLDMYIFCIFTGYRIIVYNC